MPEPAVLSVSQQGYGWTVYCTHHGALLMCWGSELMANLDALGHVAHFHQHQVP